jgi:hypothetical protein
MAGITTAEADIGSELAAKRTISEKKTSDLTGPARIAIFQHPEAAMSYDARRSRVKHMNVVVGELYIGLTTAAPNWCCFKLLAQLSNDMLSIWWWGNRTVEHVRASWHFRDKNEGTKYAKVYIELATVATIEVQLIKKSTLSVATVKAARLAAAIWVVNQLSRKDTDKVYKQR